MPCPTIAIMQSVLGSGGCFFTSNEPEALSAWYSQRYPNGRFAQDPDGNAVQLWHEA